MEGTRATLIEWVIDGLGKSVAVVLAVISSFALSLTVIPALTGLMNRIGARGQGFWSGGLSSARLTSAYRRLLGVLFAHPALAHEKTVNKGTHVIHAGGPYDSHLLVPVIPARTEGR